MQQAGDGDVGGVARRAADLALPVAASPWNSDRRARRRGHGHKVLSEPRRPMVPQPAGRRRVDRPRAMPVRFAHPCARSSATSHWAEAPFLRSRTTRSSPTARCARSWRRAATSSGCACRASTARRSSAPCSTATPGPSGSRPSTPRCPRASATCPGRWSSRRRGARARAGSSSATCCSSGPGTTTTSARTRTGARRPTTTPTTSCCARCAASTGASRCTWSASRAWTTGARRVTWEYGGPGYGKAVGTRRGRGRSR